MPKTPKFALHIPTPYLKWFTKRAKQEHTTASELMRQALREYMEKRREQ